MDSRTIINSIRLALDTNYDKAAAIKRLQGTVNRAGSKTLHIKKDRGTYSFAIYDGKQTGYVAKSSPELYRLARKRYCEKLIELLEAPENGRDAVIDELETLLEKYEAGRLDLARIVYTTKQYNWFKGRFVQKKQAETPHVVGKDYVKSKSEKGIGLGLMDLAIPFHYEEQLRVYVKPLVDKIAETVYGREHRGWEPSQDLFYYEVAYAIGTCPRHWSG